MLKIKRRNGHLFFFGLSILYIYSFDNAVVEGNLLFYQLGERSPF